jgi:UDP-N-acetylmuramate--alanine ligase
MYNTALHFHFIGLGGVGMSGIAEILLSSGFSVSGSDMRDAEVLTRLRSLGAQVFIGHAAHNIPAAASLVVYSSAVASANPEMREAKRRGLPIVRRAEVLAELMRLKFGVGVAGSHGKTTTTSMCGALLEAGQLDPTVVIGGQVKHKGSGARLGKGDFLVAETDESDRSFLLMKPTVAIVTNIDDEHMSTYRERRFLDESFRRFIESVPFYGLAILCVDDPVVRQMASQCKRRVVRYGFATDADLTAVDITGSERGMEFTVVYRGADMGRFHLPMLGRHLVQNALAAIAVGFEFGIAVDVMRAALSAFGGVKRRLEVIGAHDGVVVMNDYGHHPTEIKATLRAVRECLSETTDRFVVLFQPHRYTRTKECWNDFLGCFEDADQLFMTEIYGAGESAIEGVSGESLFRAVRHSAKQFVPSLEQGVAQIVAQATPRDLVVCLGAGSVGAMPEKILSLLAQRAAAAPAELAVPGEATVVHG